jgi:hypothetical protein
VAGGQGDRGRAREGLDQAGDAAVGEEGEDVAREGALAALVGERLGDGREMHGSSLARRDDAHDPGECDGMVAYGAKSVRAVAVVGIMGVGLAPHVA